MYRNHGSCSWFLFLVPVLCSSLVLPYVLPWFFSGSSSGSSLVLSQFFSGSSLVLPSTSLHQYPITTLYPLPPHHPLPITTHHPGTPLPAPGRSLAWSPLLPPLLTYQSSSPGFFWKVPIYHVGQYRVFYWFYWFPLF